MERADGSTALTIMSPSNDRVGVLKGKRQHGCLGPKMFAFLKSDKAHAAGIDEQTPITDVRYVAADTELTGLDEKRDSIVSIGAVRMTGGAISLGDTFYRLVNPARTFTTESILIHGITPSEVEAKPGIETALRDFLAFCGADVVVGHFVSIDLCFLDREMKRALGHPLRNPVIDTLSVYGWLRTRMKEAACFSLPTGGYKLHDIVKCFGIPVEGAHNALQDAFTTAQLFQRFLPMLMRAGARDIGDLLSIGRPFQGGDRFKPPGEFCNF
jgi:DNA polymerase-3 subunit epsilon